MLKSFILGFVLPADEPVDWLALQGGFTGEAYIQTVRLRIRPPKVLLRNYDKLPIKN